MRWAAVLLAASLLGATPAPQGDVPVAPPAYYRPVIVEGRTFPVARSSWYSVIELEDSWHDPRFRLIDGRWQLVGVHEGTDIVAEEGTPILSMAPGRVEAIGWTFYSGTRVGVRGDDGRYYFYAHLSAVEPGLAVGARVEAGDRLGLVGSTGYGDPGQDDQFPPHLHLGIQGPGGWVNPYPEVHPLYRASARVTARGERRLARLAASGDTERWKRVAGRLYASGGE